MDASPRVGAAGPIRMHPAGTVRSRGAVGGSCSASRSARGAGRGDGARGSASSPEPRFARSVPSARRKHSPWAPGRQDDPGTLALEDGVEGASELGISIADESRRACNCSPPSKEQVPSLLGDEAGTRVAGGWPPGVAAPGARSPVPRQGPGDPVRSFQCGMAPGEDGPFAGVAEAHRRAVGSARTIGKTLRPFGPEPTEPLVAGRGRTPLRLGGHRHRPPVLEHALHEELPALQGELRSRMRHESLLARRLDPDEQGGSHLLNNVLRNYI